MFMQHETALLSARFQVIGKPAITIQDAGLPLMLDKTKPKQVHLSFGLFFYPSLKHFTASPEIKSGI
jgi:hypothetical protein